MDRNGYNISIMGSVDGIDYFTGEPEETVRHEIFNGPNREKSKKDGLWIAITPEHHARIHRSKEEGSEWHNLMVAGQIEWLKADWGRSIIEFVERYGKNYL